MLYPFKVPFAWIDRKLCEGGWHDWSRWLYSLGNEKFQQGRECLRPGCVQREFQIYDSLPKDVDMMMTLEEFLDWMTKERIEIDWINYGDANNPIWLCSVQAYGGMFMSKSVSKATYEAYTYGLEIKAEEESTDDD